MEFNQTRKRAAFLAKKGRSGSMNNRISEAPPLGIRDLSEQQFKATTENNFDGIIIVFLPFNNNKD